MLSCLHCHKQLSKSAVRYCSNQCQGNHRYALYIADWKRGNVNGSRGVTAKNISGHLRRYLSEKYGDACSLCGWSMKNETTGKVPLEIDHIDGFSDNNEESNLRLICPNCHSLTPNFRNLNKGAGRTWRRLKYNKTS